MSFKLQPSSKKAVMKLKNLDKVTKKGIRQAFYKLGKDLVATAKKDILAKPRFGRTYRISYKGRIRIHVASRPGEAPASFTGTLWRSLDFKVSGADSMRFGYRSDQSDEISKTVKGVFYGKGLEEGKPKVKPRPGLMLSLKQNERNAIMHFNKEIMKAIKR
jgi:hypothetical protein